MPTGDRDQILLGHHVADGHIGARFKAQIAVGENADELAALGHGHAGDLVAPHHFEGVGNLLIGPDGDRIDDHAALRALHLVDFAGLLPRW